MTKEQAHAMVEEVWRRKISMASMSTEQSNTLGEIKAELHKEIDAATEVEASTPDFKKGLAKGE